MRMSFLFIHLHCHAKPQQEAFVFKHEGKYYVSGFFKNNKHYRLSYENEDSLLELIDLFFPDTEENEEEEEEAKYFIDLYCEDQYYYDRFRICCSNEEKQTMQRFLEQREPVCSFSYRIDLGIKHDQQALSLFKVL